MLIRKVLGLLAIGGLLVVAAPTPQAQAASPVNPGISTAMAEGAAGVVTEVQYRHRHHRHYRHYHRHHRHYYAPRVYVPRVHVPHRHRHHRHYRRW